MPAKILGVALIVAGLLLRHGMARAKRRGYVGPRYRRVHRDADRWKFNAALLTQGLGALICFVGALLCLSHAAGHRF